MTFPKFSILIVWLAAGGRFGHIQPNFPHIVLTTAATPMMDGAGLASDSQLILEDHLTFDLPSSSTMDLSSTNLYTDSSINYLDLSSTNSLELSSTSIMDLDSSLTPRPSVITAFSENDSLRISRKRSNEERVEIDLGPNQQQGGKRKCEEVARRPDCTRIRKNPNREKEDKRPANRRQKSSTKATFGDSDAEFGPRILGERKRYLEMRRKNNAAVRKSTSNTMKYLKVFKSTLKYSEVSQIISILI